MTSTSGTNAQMVEACNMQFTSAKNNSPLRTSAEEIVSSYTFKITCNSTASKISTVSGINGICVKQFSDGSLLPSYEDIDMYSVLENNDVYDKESSSQK